MVQFPLFQPTLNNLVTERQLGLVVWSFTGFFVGSDRWEYQQEGAGTRLLNWFEFEIPNPLLQFGFNLVAASLTRHDMQGQLQRLKQIAEELTGTHTSAASQ